MEKETILREVHVQISGRKEPGYPTVNHRVPFTTVNDLIVKIDALIEELDWRKVDVCLNDDDDIFTEEEKERLEEENITLI